MLTYLQFIPLFTAFFVALILLVVMTPLAHQFGLVDQPSYRKRHSGIVPLTGRDICCGSRCQRDD